MENSIKVIKEIKGEVNYNEYRIRLLQYTINNKTLKHYEHYTIEKKVNNNFIYLEQADNEKEIIKKLTVILNQKLA
tara:strand:+ start:273 stop:500 length:228 start_codon:yes stop_codon:yes gene_type:complete